MSGTWNATYSTGKAQSAGSAGRKVLVLYAEDHRNLPVVIRALCDEGCDVSLMAPRWARPLRLPPVTMTDLKEAADKPDVALASFELIMLPSVPPSLLHKLASLDEDNALVKVLRAARRLGKPVVAIAEPQQAAKLKGFGIATATAMSEVNGSAMAAGASSDCDSCATKGSCAVQCHGKVQDLVLAGALRVGAGDGGSPINRQMARMIDHTLLKADANEAEVRKLCEEARQNLFMSVCVNPSWVPLSAKLLSGSGVKVCPVIRFPLGPTDTAPKALQTEEAVRNGADEVDMVINVGALKSKNYQLVEADIRGVVQAAKKTRKDVVTKVILETALLTDEEKVVACALSKSAGSDFVKTSTGFSTGGATVRDIALMRATVGPELGVKASGGVRDAKTAHEMVAAGATRIGASASVAIVKGSAPTGSGY